MVNKGDLNCWSRTNICLGLLAYKQEYVMMRYVKSLRSGCVLSPWIRALLMEMQSIRACCPVLGSLEASDGTWGKYEAHWLSVPRPVPDWFHGWFHTQQWCVFPDAVLWSSRGHSESWNMSSYLSQRKYRMRKKHISLYLNVCDWNTRRDRQEGNNNEMQDGFF